MQTPQWSGHTLGWSGKEVSGPVGHLLTSPGLATPVTREPLSAEGVYLLRLDVYNV